MSVAEQIFEKAQVLPESAQKTILDLVETLIAKNGSAKGSTPKTGSAILQKKRVQLPLIDSREPGVLNLTNADIEELLA